MPGGEGFMFNASIISQEFLQRFQKDVGALVPAESLGCFNSP